MFRLRNRTLVLSLAIAGLGAWPVVAQDPQAIAAALGEPEWRHIGPVNMGGRISALAGIPGDPKTF